MWDEFFQARKTSKKMFRVLNTILFGPFFLEYFWFMESLSLWSNGDKNWDLRNGVASTFQASSEDSNVSPKLEEEVVHNTRVFIKFPPLTVATWVSHQGNLCQRKPETIVSWTDGRKTNPKSKYSLIEISNDFCRFYSRLEKMSGIRMQSKCKSFR